MTTERPIALLSQRADLVPSYGERRDALDQEWIRLLDRHGFDALATPNHAAMAGSLLRRLQPAMLILTGGNAVEPGSEQYSPERNQTEITLLDSAREHGTPVLGVCRGFQFMNMYLGGSLRSVRGHVGVDQEIRCSDGRTICVNSFHNVGIAPDDLSADLRAWAFANDGTVEAADHYRLPWTGIMWHPERKMPDPEAHIAWLASVLARATHWNSNRGSA